MMMNFLRQLLVGIVLGLCLVPWCTNAQAISIKEEEQLSREFLKVLKRQTEFVDDAIINDYVDQVGRKILAVVPHQPFNFTFQVIHEDVYNAFAIPAGYIFINSGLLLAMENEDELAGILSHEISHVVSRHISQRIENSKKIDIATMAGIVAGIFLGTAGGNASAAQGLIIGSAAAGQAAALGYSREDEVQADQMGLKFLTEAGYSARGLLDMLQKIRSRQWFGTDVVPSYMMTHPAVEQRIVDIDAWMATHPQPDYRGDNDAFRRVVYRLKALYDEPAKAEQFFKAAVDKSAGADAAYGYGVLLSRLGNREESLVWLRKALAFKAMDPVVLTELGKVYFLDGRFQNASDILMGVVALPGQHTEAGFYLGRSLLALEQYQPAVSQFESLLQKPHISPETYYYLGEAYNGLADQPNSHYYLGVFYYTTGNAKLALHHLTEARPAINDPNKLENIKRILGELKPQADKPDK